MGRDCQKILRPFFCGRFIIVCCSWALLGLTASWAAGEEKTLTGDSGDAIRVQRIPPLKGMKESPVIAAIALNLQAEEFAVAGDDHSIRIIKQSNGEEVAVLRGHRGWIQCLEYSEAQGLLVSGSNDGEVWLWDQKRNWKGIRIQRFSNGITALAFHPDGQRLAVAAFNSLPVLIDKSGLKLSQLQQGCLDTRCLMFSPDGKNLAAGGRDGRLRIWEVEDRELAQETPTLDAKLHPSAFMPWRFQPTDRSFTQRVRIRIWFCMIAQIGRNDRGSRCAV